MTSEICLDGQWDFLYVADDRQVEPVTVRRIAVPGPWQAQFPDLRMRAGIGIYRREFDVPVGFKSGRLFLHFGAVFHHTKAWLNGTPIGEHRGGFLPFAFDVSEYLVEGRNELKVRVESPTDNPAAFPEAPFAEIPFGKQSWYGPLSGIWQSVTIQRRNPDHMSRLRIASDLGTGEVRATVFFHRALAAQHTLKLRVVGPDGRVAASASEPVMPGDEEFSLVLTVPDVRPWSPEKPNLYRLEASLDRDGAVLDEKSDRFGFRTVETRNGRIYLNGEPIFLRAALDQDYYPDTICTVPSVEFLEDQFRKAKELGLNCLRCHIKAADPRYYEVADRIGLLIWTELPNGGLSTERSRQRKETLLKGIVDRDGNHPSIIIWTIINENWGVDLVHDGDHRAWLKRTYAWLKAYDPSRLVVDNSPLAPSFHVETDIADYHFYAAFPDNRRAWDAFVDELASRASWLYSPEGDAVIRGSEPLMCSEFGNWGLPHPDDLRDADGREPWWFETGHDWGEGVMYAHGIENRFADWSLDRVFGDLRGFVVAAQWQQYRALKYEIETMRRRPALGGYVITEFTDAHWESNGLLDMRRNPRVFHGEFARINADTVVVPRWERMSYWSGETMNIDLTVAHGAGPVLDGCRVELSIDGESARSWAVPALPPGEVADIGVVGVQLPDATSARGVALDFRLVDDEGTVLAENRIAPALHPRPSGGALADVVVWSPEADIRERLALLGYRLAPSMREAELVVATEVDRAIVAWVREGGRLVYLPTGEGQLYPFFPHWQNVRVVARDGTLWAGDWASTFAWLVRSGAFADFPGGPLIDETFDRVIPTHVMVGCNLLDFHSRVHAGMVIGWIHKPVALSVERAYGKGKFVASTFRVLRDRAGEDPTATLLLHRLIGLAAARMAAHANDEEAA
ncbi:glycoside hydrolase family 2 [Alsobacter sp. SYSU M60028]|uniref:Glycoside hydrolase family 2 n=1 Tax=Alsobacter ponti TaxID=2962936 RepID=A0ABT1L780_9HYPH|nr:sugar-binding domain-containing protein [Alsobacter ponti]MCP8937267.1 glycoside hydrolase family 2 [Alsobacter ponti]